MRLMISIKETDVIADDLFTHKSRQVTNFVGMHPKVHLHFTFACDLWLNQVEMRFGKVWQRRRRAR
jgi:hypothetical protein